MCTHSFIVSFIISNCFIEFESKICDRVPFESELYVGLDVINPNCNTGGPCIFGPFL